MAQYSFAWSGTVTGDAGPYTDSLFTQFLKDLFHQRDRINSGVLRTYNDGVNDSLEVTVTSPASAAVTLHEGAALVQGRYYVNDADVTLPITANVDGSGWDRIDTVALEVDFTNQEIRAVVVEGTAASSPVAPTLTQNTSIYQIPLANVNVPNLFITITTGIDNTVRTPAIYWSREEGGLGPNNYLAREILIGDGSGLLINGRIDIAGFILTHTAGGARSTASVSVAGAFQTIALTSEEQDTDENFSLASNQVNVNENGWYILLGADVVATSPAATRCEIRLRNVTQGVTIQQSTTRFYTTDEISIFLMPTIFQASANDKLELQIDGNGTQTISFGSAVATAVDGLMKDVKLSIMRLM